MNHLKMWPASVKTMFRLTALLAAFTIGESAAAAESERVATLRAKHASLEEPLRNNQFKQPLLLESSEIANRLGGDIYAVVNHPFGLVQAGLNSPEHWCEIMILHINTKFCHATTGPSSPTLNINIGKKTPEELPDTEQLAFSYSVAAASPDYLGIVLNAHQGPMGTSGYRILLEAVPLPHAKTFLHLTFSYDVSLSGKLAMKTYLGTIGSNKVGFSVVGKRSDGQPDYIGGVRGLMERNTMRYYLAIDTFLGAASADDTTRAEKRLEDWFTATERYPRQLREMDRQTYLSMKRGEYERQWATK
jgi:hypothetical protein